MKITFISTKTLSEFLGLKHRNVLADCEKLINDLYSEKEIKKSKIEGVLIQRNHKGRILELYLDETHIVTLLLGYVEKHNFHQCWTMLRRWGDFKRISAWDLVCNPTP
jgi:hypothetical protein